jgi:hypothetical protein
MTGGQQIAALFVQADGVYAGQLGVDVWGEDRDARTYGGPHPVVAHPPCERWGRFWRGGPSEEGRHYLGDDDGCFAHALWAVRTFGGVLEHPKDSLAWEWFGIMPPTKTGWANADSLGGWTCQIEQAHYGHSARKPTWLYACKVQLPSLIWGPAEQRLHQATLEKFGYQRARRMGMVSAVGGKDKVRIREATPLPLRDLLLDIARSAATAGEAVA